MGCFCAVPQFFTIWECFSNSSSGTPANHNTFSVGKGGYHHPKCPMKLLPPLGKAKCKVKSAKLWSEHSSLFHDKSNFVTILGGRQRAAPNVAVCAGINRLFTPRWESYFVSVLGGGTKTLCGSTYGTVRETPPYSKELRNGAETFHKHPYNKCVKSFERCRKTFNKSFLTKNPFKVF